jgi:hypothetical protein
MALDVSDRSTRCTAMPPGVRRMVRWVAIFLVMATSMPSRQMARSARSAKTGEMLGNDGSSAQPAAVREGLTVFLDGEECVSVIVAVAVDDEG